MTNYRWTDELVLGHPAMDRDHRRMLDILNRFAALLDADPGGEAVIELLASLAEHTRAHFAAEEAIMESMGFPGRETHVTAHRGLIIQLKVLTDVIADGTMEADRHTLDFLASWLCDHICGLDRELVQFAAAWAHTRTLQRAVNS